ncbi:MAG: hypothetical protein UZ15_CFX003003033 [Chloroflexi bacterium OLB15]|nr:MAG: hypothetical protein UZ15_CFX003003033 [Chloroflexi bacterium OLB15]
MRLNRGTILLILALAAIIVAALLINRNSESAQVTPTASPTVALGGPLFETLDANPSAVTRLQVRNNTTGESIAYVQTEDGVWMIEGSSANIDQQAITDTVQTLAALDSNDTFEGDDPAAFGLDQPDYAVFMSTGDSDTVYAMYIGGKTFNNARNYVTTATLSAAELPATSPLAEATAEATEAAAEATLEVTPEATVEPISLSGTLTVSTIPQRILSTNILQLFTPAILPEATLEVTPEATAIMEMISTPDAASEATAEATPEATTEAAPETETTAEATPEAEATAEVTAEATEAG